MHALPLPPHSDGMVPSAAAWRYLQPARYNAFSAGEEICSWWPWPSTFDLDIQTRPSEGPNMSSVWIWRKSVQRFPRYFIHKQKTQKVTNSAKNKNLTQFTVCGNKHYNISAQQYANQMRVMVVIHGSGRYKKLRINCIIKCFISANLVNDSWRILVNELTAQIKHENKSSCTLKWSARI